MRDGEEELDEGVERVLEGVVAVQPEDAKVDVGSAQRRLQHGEAHADALQLQWVHLLLRYRHRQDTTTYSIGLGIVNS